MSIEAARLGAKVRERSLWPLRLLKISLLAGVLTYAVGAYVVYLCAADAQLDLSPLSTAKTLHLIGGADADGVPQAVVTAVGNGARVVWILPEGIDCPVAGVQTFHRSELPADGVLIDGLRWLSLKNSPPAFLNILCGRILSVVLALMLSGLAGWAVWLFGPPADIREGWWTALPTSEFAEELAGGKIHLMLAASRKVVMVSVAGLLLLCLPMAHWLGGLLLVICWSPFAALWAGWLLVKAEEQSRHYIVLDPLEGAINSGDGNRGGTLYFWVPEAENQLEQYPLLKTTLMPLTVTEGLFRVEATDENLYAIESLDWWKWLVRPGHTKLVSRIIEWTEQSAAHWKKFGENNSPPPAESGLPPAPFIPVTDDEIKQTEERLFGAGAVVERKKRRPYKRRKTKPASPSAADDATVSEVTHGDG